MSLFKKQIEVRYIETTPRYSGIGNLNGNACFINNSSGDIFMIRWDSSSNLPVLSKIFTLREAL